MYIPEHLTGAEKVIYKATYEFEIKYNLATPDGAHIAAMKKIESVKKLKNRKDIVRH